MSSFANLRKVHNWLVAKRLENLNTIKVQLAPDADVIELTPLPLPELNGFLMTLGTDVLPTLDKCMELGWVEDLTGDFGVVRHRFVGIRPDVLTTPLGEGEAPISHLQIDGQNVLLKGRIVPLGLTAEKLKDALDFLSELIASPGNWKSGPEIGKARNNEGVRFDRIFRKLPIEIKAELESAPQKGYRVKLA